MLERRHAKGVTRRASRGNRNNRAARRVRDPYPALGGPRVAGDCPHRGSGGRGRVVSPDLSYREEGRARMDAITLPVARCTLPVLAGLAVAAPLAGQTSLSIYTDGRVVVRRTLPQALEEGRNTFTPKLEDLDPATLFSPDSSVALVSGVARPATDRDAALQHAVGQALAFVRQRGDGRSDTVRATVLRVTPPQYRLTDGRFVLSEPGEPLFPAELVRSVPEAAVVLEAARARPRTEFAWVTQGASWQAVYHVILTGARCQLSGTATITSQSLAADSAEVQLVAGSIGRARGPAPVFEAARVERMVVGSPPVLAGAAEEAVGETHVYQLSGRVSLEPGMAVTTALFPRAGVPYTQELIVPGALPSRGFLGQSPAEPNRVPVQVWYTLKRSRGTPFGDRPLPAGTVQLYQTDSAGRVQLVGEARSDHTAPGRDLRVQWGAAVGGAAARVETDYNQEQLLPPRRGLAPRQRITAAYMVMITNAKPEAVTVDVRESRSGVWQIVESNVPAEKLSATEIRFRVPVPATGTATLSYTVQAES